VDVGGCGPGKFILEELAIPDLNLIKQVKQAITFGNTVECQKLQRVCGAGR
jgi:hypothetical protein